MRSCIMNVRCGLPYVAIVHAIAGWIIPRGWRALPLFVAVGFFFVRCRFETLFMFRLL